MAKTSKAGAIYLMGIGFFLILLGSTFCWLMWRSYEHASATRHWEKNPCMIIRSEVETRTVDHIATEYSWSVEYQYAANGREYLSTRPTVRGSKWTKDQDSAAEMVKKFPVGSAQVCFVDPDVPEKAILIHDTKAAGYSIWFPGLFAIGGLGMTVGALRGLVKKPDAAS